LTGLTGLTGLHLRQPSVTGLDLTVPDLMGWTHLLFKRRH
jgi:hypothetical protein